MGIEKVCKGCRYRVLGVWGGVSHISILMGVNRGDI